MMLAAVSVATIPAGAQSVDTTALRTAIANSGGRVIIALKSSRIASLRAPGAPPVDAPEMNAIESRLAQRFALKVSGRAGMVSALFATVPDSMVGRIVADSNVELVVPDRLGTIAGASNVPGSPYSETTPWGVNTVGAPAAWSAGLTGAGVKVGVIDGGIDYTHPDLNVVGGYDFTTSNPAPSAYNDNVAPCGGHGTHVAGTIGALQNGSGVVGVAPGVQLYALKVFENMSGSCLAWESNQIAALNWAMSNGIRVVNISIGNVAYNQIYQNAVTTAIANGVTVVAAAGNSSGGAIGYPAAYAGVIAVGALDGGNAPASYESVGPEMWIAAPGTGILSTMPGGGTGTKSGTSMATPHVVGVAALMLQANPAWTATNIQLALKSTAVDVGSAGFDNYTGWGLAKAPTGGSQTVPVTISVSPGARVASVTQGTNAPADNAAVTLAGTNAATTAWTATKKKAWNTLTTSSGTGSGTVAWSRSATGLAVGTYVDTITVTAAGITGSPATVVDTLNITAPVIPVALAVSPGTRSASVVQGTNAPADNATVTLTGTNAGSTNWTATKKKAWTTLTTASGTGSGTVAWSRSASGLAVGTYVDTITVSAAGVNGSPATVFDTLKITTAVVPVAMSVSPGARSASVTQGTNAPADNATVTLTGTNAASTAWTATKKKAWTTLTTASGTGTGTVAWSRSATGLAVGTYVDTITVSATGVTGSPALVFDTLKITAPVVPVTMAVSPGSRSASVTQGTAGPSDNAAVTLTGTNAASTSWTATKKKSWLTLTTASGTGNGTITWTRSGYSMAVGTYVDTITVTSPGVSGSPAVVYDTLKVTAAIVPVAMTVSPGSRSSVVQQGTPAPGDGATVTLTGTNAGTTTWSASKKKAWITLTSSGGTGSGSIAWTRNSAGLGAGTYVDTITVASAGIGGSPAYVYDTLTITVAAVPVALAVAPGGRTTTVQQGAAAPGDAASVILTGTGAGSVSWVAAKKKPWTTLTTASGTGTGLVAWNRNTAGLAVGTYVDTLTVSSAGIAGSPAFIYDTLTITAAPIPVVIAASPVGHSVTVAQGTAAPGDVANVTLTGTDAASTAWSATNRKPWSTLTAMNGTGSGTIAWSRNAAGLGAGTYVDTITVVSPGISGSPAFVFDTLTITAAVVPVSIAVSPLSRQVSTTQGTAAPGDQAAVTLTGTDAASTTWLASRTATWTTLTAANGTSNGTVAWNRDATGLLPGTYVDTITVTAATGVSASLLDSLVVIASPGPALHASPGGRKARVMLVAGLSTALSTDSVQVQLGGDAQPMEWTATTTAPWLTLIADRGTTPGVLSWSRNPAGLAVGLHVDSIVVTVAAAPDGRAIVMDTLEIVSVTLPAVDVAAQDLFTPGQVTQEQHEALDQIGNRNGRYDIGDFLAWIHRANIRLTPTMAQRLMALERAP